MSSSSPFNSRPQIDLVSYYWNAYFEWRRIGGFDEPALGNILRSIREDLAAKAAVGEQAVRLKKLANMLETELRIAEEAQRGML